MIDYQATGQLLIAAIVAYVAWQNFKINRATHKVQKDKLRLDFFDRRLRVFEACQNLLSLVVIKGEPTREANHKFYNDSSEAEFLFGKEIENYLEDMGKKSLRMIHLSEFLYNRTYTSEDQKLKFIDERENLFDWFMRQRQESRDLFRKYLHFSIDREF